jgi:hypothetical protein
LDQAIAVLRLLPALERLVVEGTPLAVAHAAAAKRLAAKRATQLAGGASLPPLTEGAHAGAR